MATTSTPPCFPLTGLVWLSACFRDALLQASGFPTQSFRHPQSTCMWAMVSIGSMVFSSLSKPSPFLSENNSPIGGICSPVQLPHSRDVISQAPSNPDVKRCPASDRYCRFDLPAVVEQLFGPFRSLFRGNIDEEKSLPLVAIQPG